MEEEESKKGEWPPEDDYDALNDETFGGDGDDFNWDAGQAVLEFEKVKPNGDRSHGPNSNSRDRVATMNSLHHEQLGSSFAVEHLKEDYENDFDNENALEESISRLVMDDFDDDEEETMKLKLRRLGPATNLNTYFMPPQVASKHLQWFMDKELPGGSSLLGSSVWSMHPTSTPPEPAPAKPPTFSASQLHSDSINVQIGNLQKVSPGFKNEASGQVKLMDGAHRDGAVVNLSNLIGAKSTVGSTHPNLTHHKKPIFKTVEEIERELLEGNGTPNSSGNETSEATVDSNRPKIITAEELERELIQTSTPPRKNIDISPIQTPPGLRHSTPRHMSPSVQQTVSQQAVHSPTTPPFSHHSFGSPVNRPPPGLHNPPGMNMNMSPMMMQQRMIHPNMNPNVPGPNAFNQRMPGLPHQIPPNIAAQLAYQQQQQLRLLHMNPHLRGRLPPFLMPFPMGHPMRPGFPMPGGPHGMQSPPGGPGFRRPTKTDDPYSGLMNEKDKQRLRNIQIIQLQNDHPYTTDYYCLMHKVRHGVSDPRRQREYLLKLFPKRSDEHSGRNNYQPAHFENSLGKLQAVSALAPKKAIDTVIRVVDSGPTNRSGMKAYRYLLLEVEKLYECLLKIQEADIRKSLLLNADESVAEFRSESTQKVIKVLQSKEKLLEILCIKKGKMLVSRLIPLMEPLVRYSTMSHMICTFTSWAAVNNSEIEKTYPFLRHCIFAADMIHLLSIVNLDVEPQVYEYMASSKLGLSLLLAIFHRAETIISESLPSSNEDLNMSWLHNAKFAVLSILVHEPDLSSPIELWQNILPHMQRFGLTPQEMQVFEGKMRRWSSSGVPFV